MKKTFFIFQFVALFGFILLPPLSYSLEIDQEIAEAYSASDYVTTAKILEQQIKSLKEKAIKGDGINSSDLYRKYLFLGYIHAWRLNNLEKGLSIYQEVLELKPSFKDFSRNKKIPPIEFLYIGEIH